MKSPINEILALVVKAETEQDKIAVLKKYNCLALRDVMKVAFDESLVWNLPEGVPPYQDLTSRDGFAPSTLHRLSRQLPYFFKNGPGDKLPAIKREKMFVNLLEAVGPEEAKLIVACKEKKFAKKYKGITKELVKTVWPKIISQ